MPHTSGMAYVEIGVSDAERSLDFYRGQLGLRAVESAPEPPAAGVHWLDAGGALVKLVVGAGEGDDPLGGWVRDDLQRGMRHFGMKVGDVHRRAERLRSAGVPFTLEPLRAVGDVNIAFFTDPDGTLLEIIDGHLTYHEVTTPALAERERRLAEARSPEAEPVFDHVALTSGDLETSLAYYRDRLGYPVIGRLVHEQDRRGFVIDYLQAGDAVLELFTFTAETAPPPDPARDRLGLRAVGLADDPGREVDPDGVPLRKAAGR
ncbi:Catechol 2,3-dioxygenase [Streptomyces zhaozhouensis]|uniref:Catechol 2,3-dioxygenase n=1 Tax=Streptomyces zhaozhouensis TaxID=1300267 RepID=A0A286DXY5_9ACTN|nr:VOC family protein [Streptomyces zhaozhouensis]SOD63503.1 Catechol 2,3-dioxygenase [Streptomyces zhaozhouensis]